MTRSDYSIERDGVRIAGWVDGDGPRVLLLHGGPGLSYDYCDGLAEELLPGYRVASYQQRGIPPSTTAGPYAVSDHVADLELVLDRLGWDRAVLVGHSWGGHLALHAVAARPERVEAVLCVDPLGGTGDGGETEFEAELGRRLPADVRRETEEIDARAMRGEATGADVEHLLRLVWPAYFAPSRDAPPMPAVGVSVACYAETFASLRAELPRLERALPSIAAPTAFVVGGASPMPSSASTDTADRIPAARVELVDGAGHFVWLDAPGAVRTALDRLVG